MRLDIPWEFLQESRWRLKRRVVWALHCRLWWTCAPCRAYHAAIKELDRERLAKYLEIEEDW